MRLVRFVVHNWPLKLGAIGLAIILYGGMLVLQNARVWDNQIPIQAVNEPKDAVLIDPLPPITRIRYLAPADVPVTNTTFTATADLTGIQPSESKPVLVTVSVKANDPRIQILDFNPQQIPVHLDPLIRKQMTVEASYTRPTGLTLGDPIITPTQVTLLGPASTVAQVAKAQVSFSIEPSGLDIDRDMDVVAVNGKGETITGVEFQPRSVHVRMTVGSEIRSVSVPVTPKVSGTPADGYQVASVEVVPAVVVLRGEAGALSGVTTASTATVSIDGATSDITQSVGLTLPDGVESPDASKVKVVVHIRAVTQSRTIQIAVVPDQTRADLNYSLSASYITVVIGGPQAALNALDTKSLVATVSVANLGPGKYTVRVKLPAFPANIQVGPAQPVDIEVTITAVAGPSPSPSP